MTTDLFKIYKMYIQRCRRNPNDPGHEEVKGTMKYLITEKLSREDMIELAATIHGLEIELGVRKLYGPEIIQAIKSGNYIIDAPYQVQHKWRETDQSSGWLLLAKASSKPGQVKIAASSLDPMKYESTYFYKWQYLINVFWMERIKQPHRKKAQIKEQLRPLLVSGRTDGDSNEWYRGTPAEIKTKVEHLL